MKIQIKLILKALLIYLISFATSYFVVAYIFGELDVTKWTVLSRWLHIIFAFMLTIIYAVSVVELKATKK